MSAMVDAGRASFSRLERRVRRGGLVRKFLTGSTSGDVTGKEFHRLRVAVFRGTSPPGVTSEEQIGVSFGQFRALLVWNRLIVPNGKSIVLKRNRITACLEAGGALG
jgi:hypothetical protein